MSTGTVVPLVEHQISFLVYLKQPKSHLRSEDWLFELENAFEPFLDNGDKISIMSHGSRDIQLIEINLIRDFEMPLKQTLCTPGNL